MKIFLCFILMISVAHAAGKGGGSVTDLSFPFLNFFILFGTMFFMLKGKIKDMFIQKSNDVSYLFDSAEKKSKEAQLKLEMYEKKMNDISLEEKKIMTETEQEIKRYTDNLVDNNKNYISRLEREIDNKLVHEEKRMFEKIKMDLTDKIIADVKTNVKQNQGNVNKVNEKLLNEVRG